MKTKMKIKIMMFMLAFLASNIYSSSGQVTLLDPNGDGGFENGSTLTANGWSVASGVATNQWFVGNGAVPHTGSNCAYISETGNGSTYTYNFTSSSTVYFYRDIAFPAGNPRIVLKLNWNVNGEPFFDRGFVCYTDPANTPVVNDYFSSTPPPYATAVSGNFNSWSSTSGVWSPTTTYLLPASFAGTTQRIIIGWQNNNSGGTNGPIAFDNISITAGPSIVCTPVANGGLWNDPATWTNGDFPSPGDDVLIPDGVTLTLNAAQTIKNITIGQGASGVLNFTTAFNALTVGGNITINNGGKFNGFTQTQSPTAGGVTVNVAGNINLNAGGTMTMGHSSAVLLMNGTSPQSINGPGTFLDGLVRELRVANNSSLTINTPVKVTQTLRHFAGTINTNGNLSVDNTQQSFGNLYNQQVYAVSVTAMGTGYTSQPTVTIAAPSGAGTQATGVANWDAVTGTVRSITITDPGSGYRANPAVTITGGGGSGAVATAIVVQAIAGNTTCLTVRNGGATISGGISLNNSQSVGGISLANSTSNNIGYVTAPTVGFSLPVRTFLCPNPGSGYTSATVTISGGGGSGAVASATVANGKITSIAITNGGTNYTSQPTITINGVGGTGVVAPTIVIPEATATISNGMISGFTITNPGADYVTAPTITLTGGTPSAAAAAPTCRIGLYNVEYSTSSAPVGFTTVIPVVEGAEIPANRKLNALTLNNTKNLTLNNDLELTAASTAISLTGLVYFSGPNNTITCSNPGYVGTAGTSALSYGYVVGKVTLLCPGGIFTRTFPIDRHGFAIISAGAGGGTGGPGVGCDITSLTGESAGTPSGTFTSGSYTFPGTRSFKLTNNTPGSQYGTNPQAQINYTVAENLISDNPNLFVAQAAAASGPWTVRSVSSGTGLIVTSGNRQTATVAPGPVVLSGTDYFTFASTYTPPASLANYRITRTTGNTFNSIASTGNAFTWAGSSPTSTETNKTAPVSLTGTTFQFQGEAVTGFIAGLDGYLTFNTSFTSNLSSPHLGQQSGGFANINRTLAPFWANTSCASLSQIKYQIDGTLGSGSAVITIQWTNMTGSTNPVGNTNSDLTYQIKLFEADNSIEFNYGLMKAFDGSNKAQWNYACGMNGSFVTLYPAPGQVLALQEKFENTTNFTNEGVVSQSRGANGLHTVPECYSSYRFELLSPIPFVPGSGIPVNDDAANAIVLTSTPQPPLDYCGATYTSFGSTPSAPANACAGTSASRDVWFKFIATDPATAIKVVSSGGYDAVVQVFDNSFNAIATCVNSTTDGNAEVAAVSGLTIGNNYYVRVFHNIIGTQATATATITNGAISRVDITDPGSGYALIAGTSFGTPRVTVSGGGGNNAVLDATTTGTFAIPAGISDIIIRSTGTGFTSAPTVTVDPPWAGLTGDFAIAVYSNSPPPANNEVCGAIPLTVNTGSCVPTAGTTFGATASGGVPVCTAVADDDVFYSFVASTLTTSVQVFGSAGFDAVVQILSSSDNTCNGILTSIACVNNTLSGGTETITLLPNQFIAGNTYFIRVYHSSAGAGGGNFTVCVFESGPPCPVILSPLGGLAYTGGTTLTWNTVLGATGYDVYFSTVQNDVITGAPAALVSSNQGFPTYVTGPLVNGTTYYWRIDGRNSQGASAGCNVYSFIGTNDLIIGSNATGLCSGNFYDSGGPSANYQPNENTVSTICPTAGGSTKLTFNSFNTSTLLGTSDVLTLYNGPTTASPLFPGGFVAGGYAGFNAIPPGTTFTSTDASGCITVKFVSDDGVGSTSSGWEATLSCEYLCTPLPTYPTNGGAACFGSTTPLSWPVNPVALGYDVYFGTTSPPTTLVSANQPGATYNPGPLATGTYYWKVVTIYSAGACTNPTDWSFTVVDLPIPSASSNSPICEGNTLALFGDNTDPNQTTGNAYLWTGPNGFNDIFQNPIISNANPLANGTYTLTVTNQSGCSATANTIVAVSSLPALNILSQADVSCLGGSDGAFTIEVTNGSGFYLFDENGNINFDGVFTNYAAGSYTIQVTDGNSCGSSIGVTIGTISAAPPASSCTITSLPVDACVGSTVVVSTNVVPLATGYTWSAPAGTLINGLPSPQTTISNTVNITLGPLPANSSSWLICAFASNGCGITNTNCKYIRGSLSQPAPISGSTVACPSTTGIYSTTAVGGASGYVWNGTNGITFTGAGLSVTANFPAGFASGNICVAAQLPCGYTGPARCISVSNGTPILGVMNGTFTVCPGATGVSYSVPPSAGANSYNWTLPVGATIASGTGTNSITVNFGAGYTNGNVCVTAQSICGITSLPRCKTVGSNKPATPGNIVGAATGICNQTITYSIPSVNGATGYTWTAPAGATVVNGQNTNTVDVTYSNIFTTGNLCVTADNGCGSSTPRCLIVKGTPSNPGVISGPASVCANDAGTAYSIAPVFGATGYVWITPAGTSIVSGQGTTSLTLDWGSNGGTIGVTASGGCGVSGTRTLNVAMNCRVSGTEIPGTSISAYPNPVSTLMNIELNSIHSGSYSVELMDLAGRVIYSDVLNATEGFNATTLDVANYAKGVYTLSVKNKEGFAQQIRVVVE